MVIPAVLEWLRFLRNLPECQDSRYGDVILRGHATDRGDDVLALGDELRIHNHGILPGCTGPLQPMDRMLFGGLKAEH
jgi:hypothetical protein